MSMDELMSLRCQPREGQPPMASADITAHLLRVQGWALGDGGIGKSCRLGNVDETMACVNALSDGPHAEDHHPDPVLVYDRCTVGFHAHSVGGVSINDFTCAAKVDALSS